MILRIKSHLNVNSWTHKYYVCPVTFTEKCHLKLYFRYHSRKFTCDLWALAYSSKRNLKSHLHVHIEHNPYKCEFCATTFTNSNTLKSHCRIHSGRKPYKCEVCWAKFSRSNNLKGHSRIHSGERPYCNDYPMANLA